MKLRLSIALVALALAGAAPVWADEEHTHGQPTNEYAEEFQGYVPGADRLEGRILAPCCWNQTLDIHGSEIALELRREIRKRLRGGETPEAIEADFVNRYGEKILAVPPKSPLKKLAIFLSLGMGAAGVGAMAMLVRWRRRSAGAPALPKPSPTKAPPSELDERLEKELDRELENDA